MVLDIVAKRDGAARVLGVMGGIMYRTQVEMHPIISDLFLGAKTL